jgi:ketosteroid isomerase-like protein
VNPKGRIQTIVAVAGMILLTATAASSQGKKTAAKPAPDAEFKKLITEYYTAWSSMNPNNASKFYAKDAGLVFFDIAPMQYHGWTEYKEGVMKAFIEPSVSAVLTPNDDLRVNRRGTIVWTTVTFHLSAKPKAGGAQEIDARHTAIWEKRGGKWLIVHEHVSAPLPG